MRVKKLLSTILVITTLISAFSYSASASETNVDINQFDEVLMMSDKDYSSSIVYGTYYNSPTGINYTTITNSNTDYYNADVTKSFYAVNLTNLNVKDEYELKFSYGFRSSQTYKFSVSFLDSNNNILATIYEHNGFGIDDVDVKFTLQNIGAKSNSVKLYIQWIVPKQYHSPFTYLISEIEFINLDDNSNFFDGIFGTIKHIFISIVGGECSDGDYESVGLFGKLKEGFTNLGNTIGTFFSDFKQNWDIGIQAIKDKIEDIKNSINSMFIALGDKIGEFFTMLKNYLLYFQHPVTVNSDGVPIGKDGKPVYVNPFSSKLKQVTDKINEWLSSLEDFVNSLDVTKLGIISYLDTFSGIFTSFSNKAPLFTIIITFGLLLIVIKKVVGR